MGAASEKGRLAKRSTAIKWKGMEVKTGNGKRDNRNKHKVAGERLRQRCLINDRNRYQTYDFNTMTNMMQK